MIYKDSILAYQCNPKILQTYRKCLHRNNFVINRYKYCAITSFFSIQWMIDLRKSLSDFSIKLDRIYR